MERQIVGRPCGRLQAVRTRRKLFGRKRQHIFLEQLAATSNVMDSARAAGVSVQCVYQRRMRDAAFREAWGRALEQGYARLEAQLLEAAAARPIEVDGGGPAADGPLDKDLALHLLREHKKGLAGIARGGAAPRQSASWGEVEAYFIARLRALKVRIEGEDGGAFHDTPPPPAAVPLPGKSRGGME